MIDVASVWLLAKFNDEVGANLHHERVDLTLTRQLCIRSLLACNEISNFNVRSLQCHGVSAENKPCPRDLLEVFGPEGQASLVSLVARGENVKEVFEIALIDPVQDHLPNRLGDAIPRRCDARRL
ncbi:hypothetical protein D3C81_1553580 [compost metagenome]